MFRKISIIVPVYNAERYLHRCVDSILKQTFTDFELLLVNDGSKDASGRICDEYAVKDERVKVFHKQNGGVSSARNLGLNNVSAEWIAFVDSDDWIEHDYLQRLNKPDVETDLFLSGYQPWLPLVEEKTYNGREEITDLLSKHIFYFSNVYAKLFHVDIIRKQNIRFDEKMNYAEDTVFVFSYLLYISHIMTVSSSGYHYVDAENSLTKKTRAIEDGLYTFSKLCGKMLELKNIYGINVDEYCAYAGENIFRSVIEEFRSGLRFDHVKKGLKQMCKDEYVVYYLFNNQYVIKGRKRRIFNALADKKMFNLLAFYVLGFKGQIY